MGKRTNELDRVIIELASRYGNNDEDVICLKLELAALAAVKVAPKERRKSTTNQMPFKVTAKKLYLESVSADGY
jgi:hypothetical protein